ncbi:MAG: regulatory protein RecX [Nitrospirales bacterium]|nr:regulatory protein RecX [Nitrospirales bacterium]
MTFRSRKPFEDSFENCLRYSFKLLSYRDRSEREMLDKMARKGFSPRVVEEIMGYLKGKGLIDDRKLAGELTRSAMARCLGPRGIREFLMKRGVPEGSVDLPPEGDESFLSSAERLVEKRWRSLKDCDHETRSRRRWGLLSRRGFSLSIIHRVIRAIDEKNKEEDE